MPNGIHPRLSNLGIESGATAGEAADSLNVNPRLEALYTDPQAITAEIGQQQAALGNVEGGLERLLSPGGIATLLAGLGASAFGGAEAGLPLIGGLVGGSMQAAQQEKQSTLAYIEELEKRLEDMNARTAMLLQAQPGHFAQFDPVTGQYVQTETPERLGELAGVGTPINVVTKFNSDKYNKLQVERSKTWAQVLKSATRPDVRANALRHIDDIQALGMSEEEIREAAQITDETEALNFLGRLFDPLEVRDVIRVARDNGDSVLDHMGMITRKKPKDPLSFSDLEKGRFIGAVEQVMAWYRTQDPAEWAGRSFSEIAAAASVDLENPEIMVWLQRKPEYRDGMDHFITNQGLTDAITSGTQDFNEIQAMIRAYRDGDEAAMDYIVDSATAAADRARKQRGMVMIMQQKNRFETELRDAGIEITQELVNKVMQDYVAMIGKTGVPLAEIQINEDDARKAADTIVSEIKKGTYK